MNDSLRSALPLNIAHRGARSIAPENTLAAASAALSAGADMWELDVQLTGDGHLLVMHDDSLQRTSNAAEAFADRSPWSVQDFTLEEIRSLDCGSWYASQDPFGQVEGGLVSEELLAGYAGEKAPTLQEALEFTANAHWRVNVELKDIKDNDRGRMLVQQVVRSIVDTMSLDRVIVSSFNHDYLRWIRDISPSLPTAALTVWPMRKAVPYLHELGAVAHNPMKGSVRRATVRRLSRHGLGTNVWTVNRRPAMRRLIQLGVTGIITDFPQVLAEELKRASQA